MNVRHYNIDAFIISPLNKHFTNHAKPTKNGIHLDVALEIYCYFYFTNVKTYVKNRNRETTLSLILAHHMITVSHFKSNRNSDKRFFFTTF